MREVDNGLEGNSGEALDHLMSHLEPHLLGGEPGYLSAADTPFTASLLEAGVTGLDSLRATLTIRVFDEPEAHLHPRAQRAVADGLDRLRMRGSDVVVAPHSPHFLGLRDWKLAHVQLTPEGATLSPLTETDLAARTELAGSVELTQGNSSQGSTTFSSWKANAAEWSWKALRIAVVSGGCRPRSYARHPEPDGIYRGT